MFRSRIKDTWRENENVLGKMADGANLREGERGKYSRHWGGRVNVGSSGMGD